MVSGVVRASGFGRRPALRVLKEKKKEKKGKGEGRKEGWMERRVT